MSKQLPRKPHIETAHSYWKELVAPGDLVIDATCGNGHDTAFLASLNPALLYAMDIQQEALEKCRERVLGYTNVLFVHGSHIHFPEHIAENTVKLIVYNLGYLPGGNKALTTLSTTTMQSLQSALRLIIPGGAISVTCYPGHAEGEIEEKAVLAFAEQLDTAVWSCRHLSWLRFKKAPSLLWIVKNRT